MAIKEQKYERLGCLYQILSFFGLLKNSGSESLLYRLKDDFLSPAEFSFYRALTSVVNGRLAVLPKVNLQDIFFVSHPERNYSYRNRIDRKHIDFLLCEPKTMQPFGAIELDDSSHKRADRQDRDKFLDHIFSTAGLPLVRIPAQRSYNLLRISQVINVLVENQPEPAASTNHSQDQADLIPLCPKCGIPMVLRTTGYGEHKGKQFYGCINFPNCRETKKYNDNSTTVLGECHVGLIH